MLFDKNTILLGVLSMLTAFFICARSLFLAGINPVLMNITTIFFLIVVAFIFYRIYCEPTPQRQLVQSAIFAAAILAAFIYLNQVNSKMENGPGNRHYYDGKFPK